jgi:bidirectional [NiFe] hydrogenase diaphorase subunit
MPIAAKKPPLSSSDKRWRIIAGTMRRHGFAREALIETLHTVQEYFGYLDKPSLKFVAAHCACR